MLRLWNKINNEYYYEKKEAPFLFDVEGNVYIVSLTQGDANFEVRKTNNNFLLQIRSFEKTINGDYIYINIKKDIIN
jgi:hypothetical protein